MSESVFNLTPDTMLELQKELFRWQEYNFGEQEDRRMVLGICEESGELCHAHLKLEQGIRGSKEKLVAKMRDAIGDISIYALNLLSNHKEDLPGIGARKDVEEISDMGRIGDSVLGIFCSAARVETARKTAETNPQAPHPVAPHEVPAIARHVQQLFMHLNMLCGLLGWNLEKIIRETWGTVGKRNWKTNPQDGGTPEEKEKAPEAKAVAPAPRRRRRRRKAAATPAEPAPAISAISEDDEDEPAATVASEPAPESESATTAESTDEDDGDFEDDDYEDGDEDGDYDEETDDEQSDSPDEE